MEASAADLTGGSRWSWLTGEVWCCAASTRSMLQVLCATSAAVDVLIADGRLEGCGLRLPAGHAAATARRTGQADRRPSPVTCCWLLGYKLRLLMTLLSCGLLRDRSAAARTTLFTGWSPLLSPTCW